MIRNKMSERRDENNRKFRREEKKTLQTPLFEYNLEEKYKNVKFYC